MSNGEIRRLLQFLIVLTVCTVFAFSVWADVYFANYEIPKYVYMIFVGVTGWVLGKGIKGRINFK